MKTQQQITPIPARIFASIALPTLLLLVTTSLWGQSGLVERYAGEFPLHDIVFRDQNVGYALADQHVLVTTDGGLTWKTTMPIAFRPEFSTIALFGETGIIIGDVTGGIHVSAHPDSGWRSIPLGWSVEEDAILEIGVIDDQTWILVTPDTLYRTTDQGLTYTPVFQEPGLVFSGIDVTNPELIHVYERMIRVWRSSNGGLTWTEMSNGEFGFGDLFDVEFISPDTGFVASWYPWNLFTTVDGGKTWTSGPFEYPTSIVVAENGMAAYVTNQYIRTSHDFGMTWTDSIPLPAPVATEESQAPNYWEVAKLTTAGPDRIVLLLSIQSQQMQSRILQVDIASGVEQKQPSLPGYLDLSQTGENRNVRAIGSRPWTNSPQRDH